ncbi:MAG: TonB-dependent receptor [Candidatus Acidiferrum sp.]
MLCNHLTDALSYTVGKHQFRFGGEFRRAQLQEFYHRHALGNLKFDGSQGPWANDPTITDPNVKSLADFLAGYLNPDTSSIALGDPTRLVFVKTFNLFAQDTWQLRRKLTLDYGLRWDYEGPLGDDQKDLSVFIPSQGGLVFQGAEIGSVYPQDFKNFAPRLGVAYRPKENSDLVVRAGFGIYFDTPNLNPFLDNRPANGAPNGLEGNPAGPSPVDTVAPLSGTIVANQPIFPAAGSVCPTGNGCGQVYNIFSVGQDFRNAYNYNYSLNVQKALGSSLILQVGYVGSAGHRLLTTQDINQAGLNPTGNVVQSSRPYYGPFPDFGIINQIESNGNSNYNSLQAVLKTRRWHRFTGQFTYKWAHALDDMTAYRGATPQDSFFIQGDYGNSDFDTRQNFTGLLNYDLPNGSRLKLLTTGWTLSSLLSFLTGQPFNITTNVDTTGTGEGVQRVDLIGNPYAGVSRAFSASGVQWVNPAAFAAPAPGTYGTLSRNFLYGPGFGDVDFSVVKNTKITERVSTQFRIELFNLFNRINLAPPNSGCGVSDPLSPLQANRVCLASSGLGVTADTIGDYNGAPGIGPGEAFNLQLALKIIF